MFQEDKDLSIASGRHSGLPSYVLTKAFDDPSSQLRQKDLRGLSEQGWRCSFSSRTPMYIY